MRRRSSIELEINQDRWLVSYSDFVTLLFAFFVVMYSISQVNEGKYRVLSNELMKAFDVPASAIAPIQVGDPTRSLDPSVIDRRDERTATGTDSEQQNTSPQVEEQVANLSQLSDQFSEQFADLIADNLLSVSGNEMWLELELKSSILFPSANADPSLQAKAIFEEIATMLAQYNNPVQVEGFTDNVPINNRRFKNNWELSSARAASVVKLLANNGVDPTRLSAVGYGQYKPATDNDTEEGRARNRRVIVMVSREASDRPTINNQQMNELVQPNEKDIFLNDTINESSFPGGAETPDINPDPLESSQADPGLPGTDSSRSGNSNNPEANAVIPGEPEQPLIKPVELNNGGLLFTSDPDLPRSNLPTSPRPERSNSDTVNSTAPADNDVAPSEDDLFPTIQ